MPPKRNAGAKVVDGFTAVSRHPPGRSAWGCKGCSAKQPYKSAGGKWNGAQAETCTICGTAANPTCFRYGTNGKDGGKWAPWVIDDPKPAAKAAAAGPAVRSEKQAAVNEKRRADQLAKDLAKAKKELAAAKAAPAGDAGDADADDGDTEGGETSFTARKARVDALVEQIRDYKVFATKHPSPDHDNFLA